MTRRLLMQGLMYPRGPQGQILYDRTTVTTGPWLDATATPPRRPMRNALRGGRIAAWSPVCPCGTHAYPGWRYTRVGRNGPVWTREELEAAKARAASLSDVLRRLAE